MKKAAPSYVDLATIGELHDLMERSGRGTRWSASSIIVNSMPTGRKSLRFIGSGFYTISCKKFDGLLSYGKSQYDFRDGSLMFTAPGQVLGASPDVKVDKGWALFFHPDLLYGTSLGSKMHEYSFFHYEVNEALHISEEEDTVIKDCVDKIAREYVQSIDKHTQSVIVSNIELLLNYGNRFYDRQFYTRAKVNADVVQRFETLLKDYFNQSELIEAGLPDVTYFSSRLNLSANYLSDLLQKFTGKSTLEHIHLELVEKAKSLLWGTDNSISEIAYGLGFQYASHFTKIFKAKTGKSPSEYRGLN